MGQVDGDAHVHESRPFRHTLAGDVAHQPMGVQVGPIAVVRQGCGHTSTERSHKDVRGHRTSIAALILEVASVSSLCRPSALSDSTSPLCSSPVSAPDTFSGVGGMQLVGRRVSTTLDACPRAAKGLQAQGGAYALWMV